MAEKILQGEYEFKCRNCGAPLEVSPETIVAVCSYCGYPNWIREDLKGEIRIVKAMDEKTARSKAWERIRGDRDLKRIAGSITLSQPLLVYIPFYYASASAEADYWGRVRVAMEKCSGSGKNRTCYTTHHTMDVSGHYGPYHAEHPVVARRGIRAFSVRAVGHHYLKSRPSPVRLEEAGLERSTTRRILNVEIDEKDAMDIALDTHLDQLREKVTEEIRRRAEREADMRYSGSVVGSEILARRIRILNVDVKLSPITLTPLYIVPYKYRNGIYRLFISGWDGETIVAEEPMNAATRILWGIGATISSALLGGFGGVMAATLEPALIVASAIMIVFGGFISYYSIKMATRPVRVEVTGEKFRSLREMGASAARIFGKINRYGKYVGFQLGV